MSNCLSYSRLVSFWFCSHGVVAGLLLPTPHSEINSKAYFRWFINIPFLDLANSIPKKNFNSPKSFILKLWFKMSLASCIKIVSLPVISRSSTYTKIITIHLSSFLVNKEWSSLLWAKPDWMRAVVSFKFHCRLACLKPYKDFRSLHALFSPGYQILEARSCRPPQINHPKEMHCRHSHANWAAREITHLTVTIFTTGEKVSW